MTPSNPPEELPNSHGRDSTAQLRLPENTPVGLGRHVFVYGTLRRGQRNDITRLQPAPCFVGFATVTGVMVHLGGYPGVLLRAEEATQLRIQGEVYAITTALERRLDEIEMIDPQAPDDENGEYIKREIEVDVGGTCLVCLFYEINPRVALGKPVIHSGDWVHGQ
jgi:gamma-glutamylcyclotransferase (GGCT)/AIG2-like uncharacterized protein YtfP